MKRPGYTQLTPKTPRGTSTGGAEKRRDYSWLLIGGLPATIFALCFAVYLASLPEDRTFHVGTGGDTLAFTYADGENGEHWAIAEHRGDTARDAWTLPGEAVVVDGKTYTAEAPIASARLGDYSDQENGNRLSLDPSRTQCVEKAVYTYTTYTFIPIDLGDGFRFTQQIPEDHYDYYRSGRADAASTFTVDMGDGRWAVLQLKAAAEAPGTCFSLTVTGAGEDFEFLIPVAALDAGAQKPGGFSAGGEGMLVFNHAGQAWGDDARADVTDAYTRSIVFQAGAWPDWITIYDGKTGAPLAYLHVEGLSAEAIQASVEHAMEGIAGKSQAVESATNSMLSSRVRETVSSGRGIG